MFAGHYLDWNQKRIKAIVEFYTPKFFYLKRVLDLGSGYGDIGAVFQRLGSEITAVDVRQEHLKIINKKFPNVITLKADLDQAWPIKQKKFDVVLDLALMCHLKDYEAHLRAVCAATNHLVLETYVFDSLETEKYATVNENRNIYDLGYNGAVKIPTAKEIERILTECGMNFKRFDSSTLNSGNYTYDWADGDTQVADKNKRRLWFAVKNTSPLQFKDPEVKQLKPVEIPTAQYDTYQFTNIIAYNDFHNRTKSPEYVNNFVDSDIIRKHKFVIVIPAYKTAAWCEKNIQSALDQNYDKFRVLFTDDCSPDDTFDRVAAVVDRHPNKHKATISKNIQRQGALYNLYTMIHSCEDDEIILTLDGDDWFPNNEVLNKLNHEYSNNDIWMTYGQFTHHPDGGDGCSAAYPLHIVNNNSYRSDVWRASHLRTFYSWLFKSIKKEDLMLNGEFYKMTWDMAMMFPMMELAGLRHKYISDILYVYNLTNDINDHKVNKNLQQSLDGAIRAKAKYDRLSEPNVAKKNVGLLLIATNKYTKFLQAMIDSADRLFLTSEANITYFIFSDQVPNLKTNGKIEFIPVKHVPFPYASMNRFNYFVENKELLGKQNYLFYSDVDCLFVNRVNQEIFGDLVGVRHCGYIDGAGTYEDDTNSILWSEPSNYKHYFGGGFNGGKAKNYLEMAAWCKEKIDHELAHGRMPKFHDETALNSYFLHNPPDVILSPSYHYPQSNLEHYKQIWKGKQYQPKLLLLDKNHLEVRS